MHKQAFMDYQEAAATFGVGDTVQLLEPRNQGTMGPIGTVIRVWRSLGMVDVSFPTTEVRVSPEELKVVARASREGQAKRVARAYMERLRAAIRDAGQMQTRDATEMDAYSELYRRYGADHDVRVAVEGTYGTKKALYWKERGRVYCPTQQELESGIFTCPRCRTEMRRAIYKKGTKLYACPECLFLIQPKDILDGLEDQGEKTLTDWTPSLTSPFEAFNEWL